MNRFVALNGCVVGVVGEIEVEGLFAADRVFQRFQRFERQRLGQMDSRAVILRHVLHRGVGTSFGEVAEVLFGQITLGVAVARTGDVDRESHVVGVRARCAGRCPVRFADVDGVVACVAGESPPSAWRRACGSGRRRCCRPRCGRRRGTARCSSIRGARRYRLRWRSSCRAGRRSRRGRCLYIRSSTT